MKKGSILSNKEIERSGKNETRRKRNCSENGKYAGTLFEKAPDCSMIPLPSEKKRKGFVNILDDVFNKKKNGKGKAGY